MMVNYVCKKISVHVIYFCCFLLTLLSLGFQSPPAKAEIISYPAQVEGCWVTAVPQPFPLTPTCQLSWFSFMGYPNSNCNPNKITSFSEISCSIVDPTDGITYTWSPLPAYPVYTCPYGGKHPQWLFEGGYNYSPFICEISVDDINLISAKNMGSNSSPGSNCNDSNLYSGNPIHTRTGNKYVFARDYDSESINFTRYYNSKQNKLDRYIGTQWQHSYSAKLIVTSTATPPTAIAERPDGKSVFFRFIGVQWDGDGDISDKLIELPGSSWQLITSDDTIETYNTSGKLLFITNRDGRKQTLTYDTNGRLSTVTDDTGRALSFTYDGSSRINTMTDPANGVFQYTYDAAGNLASVITPDAKTRTYHYNESIYIEGGASLPNALTGITDENGVRYATYTYDTQGRAVVTEHAGGVLTGMYWATAPMAATLSLPIR